MATPDAIERGGGNPADQVVWYNPKTRTAFITTNPLQQVDLMTQGYSQVVVPGANWANWSSMVQVRVLRPSDSAIEATTTQRPISQAELDALSGSVSDINAQTDATQANLLKAFEISQPARDRAALTAKENYLATEQPTLSSAAFAGQGYHQALGDLFEGRVNRDRTLAGLADQNTAEMFQLQMSQADAERQRRNAIQQAYAAASAANQQRYSGGVSDILRWLN